MIKPIPGYEGRYSATDCGLIWSHFSGKRSFVLKQQIDYSGYLKVGLWLKGTRRTHSVHRLVAKTFLDTYSDSLQVNHIDCNTLNAKLSNLEMCTSKENIHHTIRLGRNHTKLSVGDVQKIKQLLVEGKMKQCEIALMFGVCYTKISKIHLGHAWKHVI